MHAIRQRSWLPALAFARSVLPEVKPLNLALQGGGAHGAFTWGVLDALLEVGRFRFEGVSGASAGAVNAVLLADGLAAGGPEAARSRLAAFWRQLAGGRPNGNGFYPLDERMTRFGDAALDVMTRILSPYQFNPLDYNPLRRCLEATIDFERLRRESTLRLYLAATDVANGRSRVFETSELTLEVVLASACLPHLHHAIKVGDRHYWDGGYSANPPVLPLVCGCRAEDSLIVQLLPGSGAGLPTATPEIRERVNTIVFNAPLRREMELIERFRGLAARGWFIGNRRLRRLRRHRFHLIDATAATGGLAPGTRLAPGQELIESLYRAGRAAAAGWMDRSFDTVGQRSTVDLAEAFL